MCDLAKAVEQADETQIDGILQAVLRRYAELFPDWEVSTVSVCKSEDRNEQIDRMIGTLQKMKTMP